MAESNQTEQKDTTPVKKRYRNRTKLHQTVYIDGVGHRVPRGDTILLDEKVALKHFNLFEPVEDEKPAKKKPE